MQDPFESPDPYRKPKPKGSGSWLILLVGGGALTIFLCGGCFIWIAYIGMTGPDYFVVTGNQVRQEFIQTMKEVGALEDDEKILFFYSSALTDIRDGFYFVSDKKVAVYNQETGQSPLTTIPFDQIEDLDLFINESFIEDSQITLFLKDGTPVSFPVSSENGGDQQFFAAIQDAVERISGEFDHVQAERAEETPDDAPGDKVQNEFDDKPR